VSDRVTIIGAGHVGSATAYALMLRGLFPEIVLIDANECLAVKGKLVSRSSDQR